MRRELFSNVNKIVVKVGTSVLAGEKGLDESQINSLVQQLCQLMKEGKEVVLVTSGAIGAGMGLLGLAKRPKALPKLQAAAAIGQGQLMRLYEKSLKAGGYHSAQILLTRDDLSDRKRYLNARNTIFTLFEYKALPIINENDTVSVEEIKFGDNDRLSALTANLIEADLLIILTDTDGLYKSEGGRKAFVRTVDRITPHIETLASGTEKEISVGGMATKIQAAKIVAASGVPLVLANGRQRNVLHKILKGEEIGTLFLPKLGKMQAKKRWLAFSSSVSGKIVVDEGARGALVSRGKSLLASGVVEVAGEFDVGSIVAITDKKMNEFARGLVNYSAQELKKIKGKKTNQIKAILGYRHYDEVVHRDNLAVL